MVIVMTSQSAHVAGLVVAVVAVSTDLVEEVQSSQEDKETVVAGITGVPEELAQSSQALEDEAVMGSTGTVDEAQSSHVELSVETGLNTLVLVVLGKGPKVWKEVVVVPCGEEELTTGTLVVVSATLVVWVDTGTLVVVVAGIGPTLELPPVVVLVVVVVANLVVLVVVPAVVVVACFCWD